MDNNHSWLRGLLEKHPALLVSGLYVVASVIGMLFSWDFLRRFGINVFDYAQIGDFLLASLKEPFTWALVVFAIILMMADNASSRRWAKKQRGIWTHWYGTRRYRAMNGFVALGMSIWFLVIYAGLKAERIYEGGGRIVEYQLADSATRKAATLLGTTGQFVFLFDTNSQKVYVHPHESLTSISFVAPSRTNGD